MVIWGGSVGWEYGGETRREYGVESIVTWPGRSMVG